ncbi:MAG: hypothetical protein RL472_1142 [Pseudomonadota bacterium]
MLRRTHLIAGLVSSALIMPALAETLPLAADFSDLRLVLNGVETVIAREAEAICPPNCLLPITAAEGVETLGAREVIDFLRDEVATGQGVLLDVRLPEAFAAAHVPGALNVPGVTLAAENPAQATILQALGTKGSLWVVYGDGPQDRDAMQVVQDLVVAGVPAETLRYFRGGLQEWQHFGLTVSDPASEG